MREAQALRRPNCVLLSAVTGEGLDRLLMQVEDRLGSGDCLYEVFLDPGDGEGQAWLHDRGEVLGRKDYAGGRVRLSVRLSAGKAGQAMARFGKAMRLAPAGRAAAE